MRVTCDFDAISSDQDFDFWELVLDSTQQLIICAENKQRINAL